METETVRLYCVHPGSDDASLWYFSTPDGNIWSPDTQIAGNKTTGPPSLAFFNDCLYCVYPGTDNKLCYIITADGTNWTQAHPIPWIQASAPSLADFNDRLYCAHIVDFYVNCFSTADGVTWTEDAATGLLCNYDPAIAAFNGSLYCAAVSEGDNYSINCIKTADGQNWVDAPQIAFSGSAIGGSPVLVVFREHLYCFYRTAWPEDNKRYYVSSADGENWTEADKTYIPGYAGTDSEHYDRPAITVFNGRLYCIYLNNDKDLHYLSSADGTVWSQDEQIQGVKSGDSPTSAVLGI